MVKLGVFSGQNKKSSRSILTPFKHWPTLNNGDKIYTVLISVKVYYRGTLSTLSLPITIKKVELGFFSTALQLQVNTVNF